MGDMSVTTSLRNPRARVWRVPLGISSSSVFCVVPQWQLMDVDMSHTAVCIGYHSGKATPQTQRLRKPAGDVLT